MQKTIDAHRNNGVLKTVSGHYVVDNVISPVNSKRTLTLEDCVHSFNLNPFGILTSDGELSSKLSVYIALKLAQAVDKNSVADIKFLKNKYGTTKDFCVAKDYLNKKAKIVWDVFENRDRKIPIPKEAMKALGITNQPTLEFMLGESVRFFEKDGRNTTVNIIRSILTNKNLNYTFDDIYRYLEYSHRKHSSCYNLKTVTYLIPWLECDVEKLFALGIDKETIMMALQDFPFKTKLKYLFKGGLKLSMFSI